MRTARKIVECLLAEEVLSFAVNAGVSRTEMPQIKSTDVQEFLEFLRSKGVDVQKRSISVGKLKATQKEADGDKIASMVDTFANDGDKLRKPIIASSDGHILDGHHRWASLVRIDAEQQIDIFQANVPIRKLLALAREFPKTFYKNVSEDTHQQPQAIKPGDLKAVQNQLDQVENLLHTLVTAIHGSQQIRAASAYATPDIQAFSGAFRAADNYFRQ